MGKMTTNSDTNNWLLSETSNSKSYSKTLNTSGTFLDRNIELSITAKEASPAFDGGTLSIASSSTSATGTNVAISDTDTDTGSGIYITTSGAATPKRGDVLYKGAVEGWVSKDDDAVALNGANGSSTSLTTNKYYVTSVTIPASKSLGVNATGTANVATTGNTVVTFPTEGSGTVAVAGTLVAQNGALKTTSRSASDGVLTLTAGDGHASLSASAGDSVNAANASMSLETTAPTSGAYYTLTAKGSGTVSGSGSGKVSTGTGYIIVGTTTSNVATDSKDSNEATVTRYVKKSGITASGSSTANPSATASGFTASSTATNYYVTSTASGSWSSTGTATAGYTTGTSDTKTGNATAGTPVKTYIPAGVAAANTADVDVQLNYDYEGTHPNNNVTERLVDGITLTSEPDGYYYIALSARGTGNSKITTAGYMPTGTLPIAEKDDEVFLPLSNATINAATSDPGTGYTSKSVTLASGGYLKIDEGYIPNTKISLADLVPDSANISSSSAPYLRTGYSAYDNDGTLIAGSMGDAALSTSATGSATITGASFAFNKSNNNFDITGSASISGTATASTTTTGYAVKNTTKATGSTTGTASLSATVAEIKGTLSISGYRTVTPIISRVSGAGKAGGVSVSSTATTTEPTSGYYVAVQSAANTSSLKITPNITTAGYGDATHHGIVESNPDVGAKASDVTYLPISASSITNNTTLPSGSTSSGTINSGSYVKIGAGYYPNDRYYLAQSASNTTKATVTSGTASITSLTYTYDSANSRYTITGSGDVSAPTVGSAGYISSSSGTKNKNTGGATVSTTVTASASSGALVASGDATNYPSGNSVYRVTTTAGYNASALTTDVPVYQGDWS